MNRRPRLKAKSIALLLLCSALCRFLMAATLPTPFDATAHNIYIAKANEAVIYYKRADQDYEGWGLHLWDGDSRTNGINELQTATQWDTPLPYSGIHPEYGAYFIVPMNTANWADFMFIVHKGNDKDLGGLDHHFNREEMASQYLFTFEATSKLFTEPYLAPPIAIEGMAAHWLNERTLAFDAGAVPSVKLFYSTDAAIKTNAATKTIEGGQAVTLTRIPLPAPLAKKHPHLAHLNGWQLPENFAAKEALKGQLVVATFNPDGSLETATQVQTAAVLDTLYAENAQQQTLGARLIDNKQTSRFSVWAPTAQSVELIRYATNKQKTHQQLMTFNAQSGIWQIDINEPLAGQYYRYLLHVYHPSTGKIVKLEVTDPYSLSLSTNSQFSQLVDLNAAALIPEQWGAGQYQVENPEDIVIYESHIRDFTLSDTQGSKERNGQYTAFLEPERASMQHLKNLQQAGLTHMHLLPSFDIATTDEFADHQINIDDAISLLCEKSSDFLASDYAKYCASDLTIRQVLASFDRASEHPQALMSFIRPIDNFNWGYDPFHYTVPEGSYASSAEGSTRILEYRQMVQALHNMGLNVVMDVVYNHTNEAGLAEKSVLDKIVPGYYHRLNIETGAIETSTCCKNTASEHRMMEKLMIDSLIVWARDYHIDAFRFDLMGHHMKGEMQRAFAVVKAVRDSVYFYGEGWNFGEVANGARGDNAIQWTMAGTGIGTFSDRLRDAVRGGGPFDEKQTLRKTQGFANGLYYLPNELRQGDAADAEDLNHKADLIRVGLAGNLRNFVLINSQGYPVYGQDIDYNGQPAGYTLDPQENISYVSKHDNQTLWDNNQYRIADAVNSETRVRMHNLALATNMMAQGIPFFHMGSDLLRSKSMERDSYDSGDWFNAVDFSFKNSTWARGLPRQDKDGGNWPIIKPRFANPNTDTSAEQREFAAKVFQEFLTIRQSSALFHLTDEQSVKARVDFHNTGTDQIPGVIAMSINDGVGLVDLDPSSNAFMILINASNQNQTLTVNGAEHFILHPRQQHSVDRRVQQASFSDHTFFVPAFTVAIFSQPQTTQQGKGLEVTEKDISQRPPLGKDRIHLLGTATQWDAYNNSNAMTYQGSGIYALNLTLTPRVYKLKLANANGLEYGKLAAFLTEGSQETLDLSDAIMNLTIKQAGNYRFELNLTNSTQPRLSISQAPQ